VWFHCVLRGDANFIQIGSRSNIQDGTIVHVDPGEFATIIGDDVTIGHHCIIHGCRLEDQAFVGMGSVVMNGAVIEGGGVLGARGLLLEGQRIKAGELWTGSPAKLRRVLSAEEPDGFIRTASHYVGNASRFQNALAAAWT
jgi:carbonic anhydrase/acetyltransferase-like protein (isoleucine patch superfamily)